MTWAVINTSTTIQLNDFAAFGALSYADGSFADGEISSSWSSINTTETANWSTISTSSAALESPFNAFASMAYAEGDFADGSVTNAWTNINTV